VKRAIDQLCALVNYTRLYIGGGNARLITMELPPDVELVDNTAGIWGGLKLWEHDR
jgi:polyphosphate glucokinase